MPEVKERRSPPQSRPLCSGEGSWGHGLRRGSFCGRNTDFYGFADPTEHPAERPAPTAWPTKCQDTLRLQIKPPALPTQTGPQTTPHRGPLPTGEFAEHSLGLRFSTSQRCFCFCCLRFDGRSTPVSASPVDQAAPGSQPLPGREGKERSPWLRSRGRLLQVQHQLCNLYKQFSSELMVSRPSKWTQHPGSRAALAAQDAVGHPRVRPFSGRARGAGAGTRALGRGAAGAPRAAPGRCHCG